MMAAHLPPSEFEIRHNVYLRNKASVILANDTF